MKAKMKDSMTAVHAPTIVEIAQTLTCSVLAVMKECIYMKTDALMNVQSKFFLCIHVQSIVNKYFLLSEMNIYYEFFLYIYIF